jgi:hypothetical protein
MDCSTHATTAQPSVSQDGLEATRQHIDRLTAKINTLTAARADAHAQLEQALTRAPLDPSDKVDWWQWGRTTGARTVSMCAAMGTIPQEVAHWFRVGPPPPILGRRFAGDFPLYRQWLPKRGQPCVYALLVGTAIVYIGQSRNISDRLRDHWRNPKNRAAGVNRWEVVTVDEDDNLTAVERTAIFQHQPDLNTVGKGRRL